MKDYFRKCLKCRKDKSIKDFYFDKFSSSGWYHRCKVCTDYYYKKCTMCERFRSKALFYKNKNSTDKLEHRCKICRGVKKAEVGTTYFQRHKKEMMDNHSAYVKRRNKVDPFFLLSNNLRTRLSMAIKVKSWHKDSKFKEYIGCGKDELIKHIESQWKVGMNWENYGNKAGSWNIDHIYPLSKAATELELIKLCHFSNLQPMWSIDNYKKGNRIR